MINVLTVVHYVPKRTAVIAGLVVAALTPAALLAWGPDRPTFTMESPAPYVTFNSMTNNPNYGDEREFMTVKNLTTGETRGGSTKLIPGNEYQFQIYVHNNAASNLNASGVGVAKDVTVRAALPASVNGSDTVDGFVRASNAQPAEVYDSAALTSDSKVELDFVEGSAMLSTNSQQTKLPDSVITTGVKVGDKDLSGDWRGCLQYAGAVTFKVKVKEQPAANYTFNKLVRISGTKDWQETVSAKPGETVEYLLEYKNTGDVIQNNVTLKDTLPKGMTYVKGSSTLKNANFPQGKSVDDSVASVTGINIGHYAKGGAAYLVFKATIDSNNDLPACGQNTLRNIAKVETGAGSREDAADVTVNKECKDTPAAATPTELPKTGPAAIAGGIFGSSALGLGVNYWLASRRALRGAING